jgi:exopolysaccharide biosynthesis predicted pyruvyltransferase EpsI
MIGPLNWNTDNTALAELLSTLKGQEVLYFINPGNAGDGLIAQSTYELLKRYDIQWKPATKENLSDRVVIIAGGGNLVGAYTDCQKIAFESFQHAKMTIILPHTIRDHVDTLRMAGRNTHIFCRDLPSRDHVVEHAELANVYLGHDLAFFGKFDAILEDKALARDWEPKMAVLMEKSGLRFPEDVIGKHRECFRSDREKTKLRGGPKNLDISNLFRSGVEPSKVRGGVYMFLRFIQLSGSLVTNRLHVGVGSAILGTAADLYDNSYGKNSAVYEFSMKGRYPSVSLRDT